MKNRPTGLTYKLVEKENKLAYFKKSIKQICKLTISNIKEYIRLKINSEKQVFLFDVPVSRIKEVMNRVDTHNFYCDDKNLKSKNILDKIIDYLTKNRPNEHLIRVKRLMDLVKPEVDNKSELNRNHLIESQHKRNDENLYISPNFVDFDVIDIHNERIFPPNTPILKDLIKSENEYDKDVLIKQERKIGRAK